MKRRAVLLFTAAIIMLCTQAALANTVCQNLIGTWTFNYGGSDNRTVYVPSVNDFDTNGGVRNSVFTCWAYAVDANGNKIMLGGAITEGQTPYAPTTLGYYETYEPGAETPYDRINLNNFTGSSFDNVTKPLEGSTGNQICSFYPGGTATCYWLNSGLQFGRKTSPYPLIPGKCADWLGRWNFTYFNLATIGAGNLTDNITDNVTITNVCDDNKACVKAITDNVTDNGTWSCIATGRRISDNTTMFIGKVVDDDFYYYFNYDNYTKIVANISTFGQINDTRYFTTEFTADLSALDNDSKNAEPTNLISGNKITTSTTTTSAPPGIGTCKDWLGTWTLSYDSTTDTLPGDALGNGRNGDYEVKVCKFTENFVFASAPTMTFPCFAEGTRTVDGKLIYFIASPFDPVTAYRTYYYELEEYPSGALSNGAAIAAAAFTGTGFTPVANTFGLTKGIRTNDNSCELPCIDKDKDGYGVNCSKGLDCDDNDPSVHDNCDNITTPCELKVWPKKFSMLTAVLDSIQIFVISGGTNFAKVSKVDWETTAISTLARITLGKKTILGLIYVRPFKLGATDNYSVTVTYGDNDTACAPFQIK